MKKLTKLLTLAASIITLAACNNTVEPEYITTSLLNGGFETSTLSGWEIEYGTAFNDDCVTSDSTFSFDYDARHNQIEIGKEGNWYLSGKGFEKTFSHGRIGAIRSNKFVLTGDGSVSIKLAGGALTKGKGEHAEYKRDYELCYAGIYLASNDRLISRIVNDYFIEHTEDYVDANKYANGVYSTDNFNEYTVDLSKYKGEEIYVRIVDNDKHHYYGYISVDDIRIGGELPQSEGSFYVKSRDYEDSCLPNSEYEIANPDFECGSLAGWTILEGQAFSNEGVNQEETWWNENIPYQRDGNYHYGFYKPEATGRMRSSEFILGGSGYVTFKLGGCMNNDLTYLSFFLKGQEGEEDIEVARYSNRKYWNFQFPYVPNGMRLLNMVQYVADLREYFGQTMYIEVVDNNSTGEVLGCITLDSIYTYNETKPTLYTVDHYDAHSMFNVELEIESEFQVKNGTFETGDLTGWTLNGDFGEITDKSNWWNAYPFNRNGSYCFSGETLESGTGTLVSSSFKVGGINKMSFLMGGAKNPYLCYVALCDSNTNEELARYSNCYYHDIGTDLINKGSNLLNMQQYVADLSEFEGRDVYLKVVDNATNDWGLLAVDSFITYYADESHLPEKYYDATDVTPVPVMGNEYQIQNGNFETGDLTGWTISGNVGNTSASQVWWHEWYSFNKEGLFFFNGWNGSEDATGSLTSSAFKVGGTNKISFKLGGGKNKDLIYVEIIDATTEAVLETYSNYMFNDVMGKRYYYNGEPNELADDGIYMANMVTYIADLSEYQGRTLKLRVVDNATNDWGLFFLDDVVTYYESESLIPQGLEAR